MLSYKDQSYIDKFTPKDWYVLSEEEINDFIVNMNLIDMSGIQISHKRGSIISYLNECRRDADSDGCRIISLKKEIVNSICAALTMQF